jgi:hypothetical protein
MTFEEAVLGDTVKQRLWVSSYITLSISVVTFTGSMSLFSFHLVKLLLARATNSVFSMTL